MRKKRSSSSLRRQLRIRRRAGKLRRQKVKEAGTVHSGVRVNTLVLVKGINRQVSQ